MANYMNCDFNKPKVCYCKYCNKECKSTNSLKQHECRCKENPNARNRDSFAKYVQENRKGKNKYNSEDVAKISKSLKEKYANGYDSPLLHRTGELNSFYGKHHSEETKRKISSSVSKSRIEGYANGTIKPARGIGRGKYSYICYKDKKYMLRSTYEFIYALYLLSENIEFELEAIRVPACEENEFAKTFISDFSYGNTVVEIKGIKSKKDYYIKKSFEDNGYKFIELFQKDIDDIKYNLISKGYDIDDLLLKVVEGNNNKNYFIYNFS